MRIDKAVNELTEADYVEADKVWGILGEAWIKLVREYGAFKILSESSNPHPLTLPGNIVTVLSGFDVNDLKLLLTAALYDQYQVRAELRRVVKELDVE